MIQIAEHTIEETLINKDGWVLDLGCVNFSFSKEVKKYCNNVLCLDPNPTIKEAPEGVIFENAAIITGDESEIEFYIYNDVQTFSLLNPKQDLFQLENKIKVRSVNIKSLMEKYGIEKFELIKVDIEGGEYDLLKSWDWSISKQFSVEFHDFRFMNPHYPNNEKYYQELFSDKLSNFKIATHELTDHPGFPFGYGRNYWDSLFIEM
jgi:FkbM family methyltransferase